MRSDKAIRWQRWFGLIVGALIFSLAVPGRAAPPSPQRTLYTIAIGQNEAPAVLAAQEGGLAALRFADDDAVNAFFLLRPLSRAAFLLAVPDSETQARVPKAVQFAQPASLVVLEQTIERVKDAMQRDRAGGREPELVLFFSGHGVRDMNGAAALALFDGALTQRFLYDKVLAQLPARHVHLIIDACHAGAVVRSRDVDATLEPLSQAALAQYVEESTLARFPHVGAILASTASTQSFEWDGYRSGVFAHELMSGLRGAADVNADGRIEYSELAAFFSAANLQVSDPRARLAVVVQPPRTNARVAVLEHTGGGGEFKLVGHGNGIWAGAFYVESENGSRLLDVFPERDASLRLWLPSREKLYVVRGDQEVVLSGVPGAEVSLASLKPRQVSKRSRGALESSLRRGLFGTRYGPAFYLGYTTQRSGLIPVPLDDLDEHSADHHAGQPGQSDASHRDDTWRKPVAVGLFAGSGVLAIVSGVFAGMAIEAHSDFEATEFEQASEEARSRFNRAQAVAWGMGAGALALGAAGATLWFWPKSTAPVSNARSARLEVAPASVTLRGSF